MRVGSWRVRGEGGFVGGTREIEVVRAGRSGYALFEDVEAEEETRIRIFGHRHPEAVQYDAERLAHTLSEQPHQAPRYRADQQHGIPSPSTFVRSSGSWATAGGCMPSRAACLLGRSRIRLRNPRRHRRDR